MTDSDVSALCAEMDALVAASRQMAPDRSVAHLGGVNAVARAPDCVDPRPDIVADPMLPHHQIRVRNKVPGTLPADARQCACAEHVSPPTAPGYLNRQSDARTRHEASTNTVHLPSSTMAENREGAGRRIAAESFPSARKPRRSASKLDQVAARKTWDGTKSKGRRDRVNEAEKFSAAVWQTSSVKGLAVSLNLGNRREVMLLNHGDPKRRLTQNLSKHLSEAGLQSLPYALVFELTPDSEGGRLHLHGVIDTSSMTEADIERLRVALRRAASEATGAVGGDRQLDLRSIHDPAGWADYLLKDVSRTNDELRIDNPFMISKPMRRLAKTYFERFRSEVRHQVEATPDRRRGATLRGLTAARSPGPGFTVRSHSARRKQSGERDKMSAGGARSNARHQPHRPLQGALRKQAPAFTSARTHKTIAVATAQQVL